MKPYYLTTQEVGVDEAGRGSLVGPVFASAVIFPENYMNDQIKDSKKLSKKKRGQLIDIIQEDALDYAVAYTNVNKIDEINILQATFLAMHTALQEIKVNFNHIIVDGNEFIPFKNINNTCIKQGDSKYISIAASSILSKYYRDQYIINEISPKIPYFNLDSNKGYGTKDHKEKLYEFGPSEFHRKSFNPVKHMI